MCLQKYIIVKSGQKTLNEKEINSFVLPFEFKGMAYLKESPLMQHELKTD